MPFFAGAIEHFSVKDHYYTILTESYNLYNTQGESMKIYEEGHDENLRYVMTFVLHDKSGDCSGKSLEDGAYSIDGNHLTLYTLWNRRGDAHDAPYGARIKQYEIGDDGLFHLKENKIYIQMHKRTKDDKSGMQYLFVPPKTEAEKEKLDRYVSMVEKLFQGKFVFGQEAQKLLQDVNEAVHPVQKSVWKGLN